MSYMSDATEALCSALAHCFGGYSKNRLVRTSITTPMDDVAIVDFSITAEGIEVYGSISIVIDVADWFGICFVSYFSPSSVRWLRRGPLRIGAPEFAQELVAACADVPEIASIHPAKSSCKAGFHFDLEAR